MSAELVGYVACVFSVGAFLPQIVKVVRTRKLAGLSTPMWIAEVITFALWTVYGALLVKWPIIITNAVCFVLSLFILVMKLVSRRTRDKIADALDPTA